MHILMPLSEALSSSTTGIMSDICIIWTEFFMCVCVCVFACVCAPSLIDIDIEVTQSYPTLWPHEL